MNQINKFSQNLPARIKHLEETINLLNEEKELVSLRLEKLTSRINIEPNTSDIFEIDLKLSVISDKKKIEELGLEILSKKDFLKTLKSKMNDDEKEMKRNIAAAHSGYQLLLNKAEKFLDEDEIENGGKIGHVGNYVQYVKNEMIIAHEEKNEVGKVHFFNRLKKQITLIEEEKKKLEETKKENKEHSPLKESE